jgi:ABC-2 type transport system ATP-binding protein
MIKVNNLSRAFGSKLAVNKLSFEVQRGEVLGFLGPNGAGKSTTMRMITGFIPPSEGSVTVGGHDIVEQPIQAKRLMGYLPENAPSYADMTVHGFLSFVADVRGFTGAEKERAVRRAVETCFLEPVIHQTIETLSKGYRHRTCFAQSIIHDPEVLILDEPTDGLDPNQKHEVRTLIRKMGEKKAIIFSTHILEEVEAVCSRAIIIDRGQIVANGTPAELKRRSDHSGTVLLRIGGLDAQAISQRMATVPTVRKTMVVREQDGKSTVRIFPSSSSINGDLPRSIFEVASKEGWKVEELHTEEGRLDEVFRNITLSDTVRGKTAASETISK